MAIGAHRAERMDAVTYRHPHLQSTNFNPIVPVCHSSVPALLNRSTLPLPWTTNAIVTLPHTCGFVTQLLLQHATALSTWRKLTGGLEKVVACNNLLWRHQTLQTRRSSNRCGIAHTHTHIDRWAILRQSRFVWQLHCSLFVIGDRACRPNYHQRGRLKGWNALLRSLPARVCSMWVPKVMCALKYSTSKYRQP